MDIFTVILGNLNNVNPSDDFLKEPQKGGDSEGSDSSDDGQGSSDNTMSDEDFNDLMDSIGKSPMTGDSNDTTTGGNGMYVDDEGILQGHKWTHTYWTAKQTQNNVSLETATEPLPDELCLQSFL